MSDSLDDAPAAIQTGASSDLVARIQYGVHYPSMGRSDSTCGFSR